MTGRLIIVGMPIGNSDDITLRALDALKTADMIIAENPRRAAASLAAYDIEAHLVDYRIMNDEASATALVHQLVSGLTAALISDAGMPIISDPGHSLISLCLASGVEIDAAPGVSALTAAIALSGINCSRFCFEGFLSTAGKSRREHLEALRNESRAMIFYEASKKLSATLADFAGIFGGDRQIAICCNLTMPRQLVFRGSIEDAHRNSIQAMFRGEITLVVSGKDNQNHAPF